MGSQMALEGSSSEPEVVAEFPYMTYAVESYPSPGGEGVLSNFVTPIPIFIVTMVGGHHPMLVAVQQLWMDAERASDKAINPIAMTY